MYRGGVGGGSCPALITFLTSPH